jgi:hypothetical protein
MSWRVYRHVSALLAAATLVGALFANTASASEKHWYCVVSHQGLGPHCQSCWAYVGGELGRVGCAVVNGPSSVRYGQCTEKRNRPPC